MGVLWVMSVVTVCFVLLTFLRSGFVVYLNFLVYDFLFWGWLR